MKSSSRRKHERLKILGYGACVLVLFVAAVSAAALDDHAKTNIRNHTHDSHRVFAPRMDYDQWKPLGRGDPLQNDPTYDYVPPVLDRVHYWMDAQQHPKKSESSPPQQQQQPTEGSSSTKKSEILVLGVSSKKPSSNAEHRKDPYDPFLKFIDGPKFYHHQHHQNSFPRPNRPSSSYHPQFFNKNAVKFVDKGGEEQQRMPYTVLVPPPVPPPHMEMPLFNTPTTQRPVYKPTTTTTMQPPPARSTVSVQQSNLIYLSSSVGGGGNQWHNAPGPTQYSPSSSQYVTWRTPTEVVTKGNPIVFTKNNDVTSTEPPPRQIQFPTESSHVVFEQHSLYESNPSDLYSDPAVHVLHVAGAQPAVTHMSVGSQPMHKGQVSDDTIGNAYVNIGKPNAHILQKDHPTPHIKEVTTIRYPDSSTTIRITNGNKYAYANQNGIDGIPPFRGRPGPITEEVELQTMQTMQPPPKRVPATTTTTTTTTEKYRESFIGKKPAGFLQSILRQEESSSSLPPTTSTNPTPTTTFWTTTTTTTAGTTTASVASLTTDPLFKHYKQPIEPLKGPSYLIIQGHSKVKNYGAAHSKSTLETNEIPQSDDKFKLKIREKAARSLKLIPSPQRKEIQETELGAKYEVGGDEVPTEKYHRGIVESEELGDRMAPSSSNRTRQRQKRQFEEFIPVVEDAVESYVYDYLKKTSEGSGVGAVIASAITSDSADEYVDGIVAPLEDDDEEEDDDDSEERKQ